MKKLQKIQEKKFENQIIDLSKVKGGSGEDSVRTGAGTLGDYCYDWDLTKPGCGCTSYYGMKYCIA